MANINSNILNLSIGKKWFFTIVVFLALFLSCSALVVIYSKLSGNINSWQSVLTALSIQNLVLFIAAPFILSRVFSNSFIGYLKIKNTPKISSILWGIACMITAAPALNFVISWNEGIHLPEALAGVEAWFRASEDSAMAVTNMIMNIEGIWQLIITIIVVGVLTGIGEELTFRGIIQQLFVDGGKNRYVAVWLTAIIFSAIHFQFFGFVPRVLLGALFGYMFIWSGSIWLPIIAHIFNNSVALLSKYLADRGAIGNEYETVGTIGSGDIFWVAISIVMFAICLRRLHLSCKK